jgi:hypothetical protein
VQASLRDGHKIKKLLKDLKMMISSKIKELAKNDTG